MKILFVLGDDSHGRKSEIASYLAGLGHKDVLFIDDDRKRAHELIKAVVDFDPDLGFVVPTLFTTPRMKAEELFRLADLSEEKLVLVRSGSFEEGGGQIDVNYMNDEMAGRGTRQPLKKILDAVAAR